MPDRYFVVVDGYSSGNLLPAEFAARGIKALHVSSTPEIWPLLAITYRPDDYAARFAFDGDIQALAAQVAPYQPLCVIPGTETGVPVSDALSEALGVFSNGTALASARRNKYDMIEAVRAAGLRAARQIKSRSADEIVGWVREQGLEKVVIKPLESAGSDAVATCRTPAEIREACARILDQTNQIGIVNDAVLCQEFLHGTEYALDAVSRDGKAHFTAVWRYYKQPLNDAQFVYDRDELVSCTDAAGQALCAYARQVFDALGIVHGPTHSEIMLTPDGPVLVEIGPRLNGITAPAMHARCVGYGQLDLTADAYVDPDAFAAKSATPYELKAHAISISLWAHQEGVVKTVPGEPMLRALPSFDELRLRAKPGYKMRPTIDFFTHPGFLNLIHPDRDAIQADLDRVRGWEREGVLYEMEETTTW